MVNVFIFMGYWEDCQQWDVQEFIHDSGLGVQHTAASRMHGAPVYLPKPE